MLITMRPRHRPGRFVPGLVPAAPTINIVSPITNPPSVTVGLPSGNGNYLDAQAGDVLEVAFYSDAGLTTLAYGPFVKTLSSSDIISGGSVYPITTPFDSGTYYPAAWLYRSGEGASAKGSASSVYISSLLTGLISSFDFTEGSGNIAHDAISGLNATILNSPSWVSGGGIQTTSTAQTAGNAQSPLLGTSALTIAVKFKTVDTVAGHFLVDIGSTGGSSNFGRLGIAIENGVVAVRVNGANAIGGSRLNNNSPHVLLIEKPADGTTADITATVDNVPITLTASNNTTPISLVDDGTGLYVLHGFLGTNYYSAILNRMLTSAERTEFWNGGSMKEYPFS